MAPTRSCYLDYNASTPVLPQVTDAVVRVLGQYGNPSSVHAAGRHARAAVEDAREAVAGMVNASPAHVIFTSGGTESNALALRGLAMGGRRSAIVASGVEHPSVLAHAAPPDRIAVDADGVVDLNALEQALRLRPPPVLIALMFANNETGVLQPVAEVVTLARRYDAMVHCDAVQAPGKMPVDIQALGVDSLSLSAHKFGGLKGAGALVLRPGMDLAADIRGGGQERQRRAGTENVVGIVGFGAAAREARRLTGEAARITALRDALETGVQAVSRTRIFAQNKPRLPNTSCIALAGVSSETQVMRLDLAGVAVSAGSACSSGKIAASHVLLAMGVAADEAKCAIRVSLGWDSRAEDVTQFLDAWRPLAASAAA